jgi:hypothetical protein
MDQLISLWGKVLAWLSNIKSKYDYLARNQGFCPQAGQAFTFFLQQKKVNKKCRR